MEVDQIKARLVQLGFKQATQGLTPSEQEEMRRLQEALDTQRGQ